MRTRVVMEHKSIEELCFDWLKQETGEHDKASRLAASGYVEDVLAANPGLAELQAASGDSVPLGTVIRMPPLPDMSIVPTIKLWD